MVYEDSRNKNLTQTQPKQTDDSLTKVTFSKSGVYKYVSGVRRTIGFKGDLGLYNRFKQLSKRVYGSTCKAFEIYMVSFISSVENGVNLSNTVEPINVEQHIRIERLNRERRHLDFVDDFEGDRCLYCGKVAVGSFRYLKTGRVYPLCRFHAGEFVNGKSWEMVKDE